MTIDHVNPEAPWPELDLLRAATESRGLELAPRLTVYPGHIDAGLDRPGRPAARAARPPTRSASRARMPGRPARPARSRSSSAATRCRVVVARGARRGRDRPALPRARRGAPARLRRRRRAPARGERRRRSPTSSPGTSSTRTSATSAAASAPSRRGSSRRTCAASPTSSRTQEIVRRAVEAWERGATEICLQGGIHPGFDGDYYVSVVRAIKDAVPDLHVHAFSALEIWQGAATLGVPLRDYLERLRDEGLASLPGHRRRGARRRGPRRHLPGQDHDRAVARGAPNRARGRPALEQHDHVRPRRRAAELGAAPARRARAPARDRRLHRVRPAPVRAHGGADLPEGPGAPGPDLRRGAADARGRPARAAPVDRERPGLLGQGRPARRPRGARRRRQRPRRHADERVDLALGRSRLRPGARRPSRWRR